ncbi:thioredoxin [Rathayibacter tritici]|uniref:Thioredoxin n=1 Tax=Rathayibacter tritici TaxID=33888 RepID=A0A160KP27_9MICO|nr:thioredoxin family protein [Rathayibacter tritici]AND15180.1 thioredoxin [Rathayibacter tritici]PPF69741.1 thioredoxin [Rathayibacter tritici]PPG09229.1 thioredoxin [Rathayibacter tritici]PPI47409.1 thioredoxin [Rathayibacter tritici]
MIVEFYTSAFCGACHAARSVLERAAELVPAAEIREYDVAFHPVEAEAADIRSTPTVVVRDSTGDIVFRAEGAPSLPQALAALALALPA